MPNDKPTADNRPYTALRANVLRDLLGVAREHGVSQLIVQADGGFQVVFSPPEPPPSPLTIRPNSPLTAHDLKEAERDGSLFGAV